MIEVRRRGLWKVLTDLTPRVRRVRSVMAYDLAEFIRGAVSNRLRAAPPEDNYGPDLQVQVHPTRRKAAVFAIRQITRATPADRLNPETTVVYIRPKGTRPDPVVQVLAKHSPWPVGELPALPSPRKAKLIYRRVTRDEVLRVGESRRRDRQAWDAALRAEGVRPEPVQFTKATTAHPDALFQALRLEFGSARTKALPHWRPSLREVPGMVRTWVRSRRPLKVLAMAPRKAKKVIPRLRKVTAADLEGLSAFVDRLG